MDIFSVEGFFFFLLNVNCVCAPQRPSGCLKSAQVVERAHFAARGSAAFVNEPNTD